MSINESEIINSIGLGTAAIGRPQYINIKNKADAEFSLESFKKKGLEILDQAYQHGIRYFDTAPGYGLAEQLLIDWKKEKEDSNIEMATKWGYTYVANFDPNAIQHEVKEHSLDKLNEQWEQSKNLFPFLTTYQIHSTTFETGVLENKRILNQLAELKQTYNLHIGLSTTGSNQSEVLKKALDIEIEGQSLFNVFQVTYNVFDQSLFEISDRILKEEKRLVVKEALANGRIFPNDQYFNYKKAYIVLEELAQKYEVGIDSIGLRFCIDSISPFKVLSGVTNESHLLSNLQSLNFKLEDEDMIKLKKLAIQPAFYWNERKQLGWN